MPFTETFNCQVTRKIKRIQRWPVFYDLLTIEDAEARYYCIALVLLQSEIAAFMSPNPSTIYILFKTMEEHFLRLLDDTAKGCLGEDIVLDPRLKEVINKQLNSRPDRAQKLREIYKVKGNNVLNMKKIWPSLSVCICWQSEMLKPYIRRLAEYLDKVDTWDHLYQASEGIIAIPNRPNESGGILNLLGNFYEFIPSEENEKEKPTVLLLDELEKMKKYEVVLTNTTGLYRYRIGDIIRVKGFIDKTPLIEFISRTGKSCSITGEKLTEEQVVHAFEATNILYKLPVEKYKMFPVDEALPHYGLLLEMDRGEALCLQEFGLTFESKLCENNLEYYSKRKSNRLGPLTLFIIENDKKTLPKENQWKNKVMDQTKPQILCREFNLHNTFRIKMKLELESL